MVEKPKSFATKLLSDWDGGGVNAWDRHICQMGAVDVGKHILCGNSGFFHHALESMFELANSSS